MQVLVIEDDDTVAAPLCGILRHHGFSPTRARNAREGLDGVVKGTDVVLLDLGLPDRDGVELLHRIREITDVPVIVVTARADLSARLHGLGAGADDYVIKPYDVRELMARIHAVSRRARREQVAATGPVVHVVGALRVDEGSRQVRLGDSPVALSRKEFDLLALLVRQPGVVFRREQICSELWQTSWRMAHRSLEVHIASVRTKLGDAELVETVRGVGYRLRPSATEGTGA